MNIREKCWLTYGIVIISVILMGIATVGIDSAQSILQPLALAMIFVGLIGAIFEVWRYE